MNNIIQEIMAKIIKDNNKNIEKLFTEHKDISIYILDTKKMLDEIGTAIVEEALKICDEIIKESSNRKKNWYVQRKADEKTLTTIFGEVHYTRTYYKNKKTGEYRYLSDEVLGIEPHDRMDISLKAKLVEKSLELSYRKSGESISENVNISDQTVMNCIRELGIVENNEIKVKSPKKVVDTIYIEADEDHIAMQNGKNKEIKLVYVHEGKKKVGKERYELINTRYFTGNYNNSEQLWLEVADYLDKAYDMEQVKTIYLSGDGARWIKEGLNWIKGSEYVLDYFHLSKYVKKATAHMPHVEAVLWGYINKLDKKSVKDLFEVIIDETESITKKAAIKDCRRYILNNWEGIENRYGRNYIGCSAEGHISHILSARLSSRPLAWSIVGADQMARLRVHRANGGKVYETMIKKRKEKQKEKRIEKLDQRVVKRKLNKKVEEKIDNITVLNIGKRTWASELLKSIRGA